MWTFTPVSRHLTTQISSRYSERVCMDYRPWGLLDWTLGLAKPRGWYFVGALGTEKRSLAAWHWLKKLGGISATRLLEVLDRPSRHTARATQLTRERTGEFFADGGIENEITRRLELMTEIHRVVAIANTVEQSANYSVVLDITSLPKRFFSLFCANWNKAPAYVISSSLTPHLSTIWKRTY